MNRTILLAAAVFSGACAQGEPREETTAAVVDAAAAIDSLLVDMQTTWNRDSLAGHVSAYADSGTYTTPSGLLVGRDAVEEAMAGFVTPNGLAGELRFEDVLVRMLGDQHALVTGAFIVADVRDTMDIRGRFSLVMGRTDSGWRVLHDHSS